MAFNIHQPMFDRDGMPLEKKTSQTLRGSKPYLAWGGDRVASLERSASGLASKDAVIDNA